MRPKREPSAIKIRLSIDLVWQTVKGWYRVAFFAQFLQGDVRNLYLECSREVAMNTAELKSFLESLTLSRFGYEIKLVEREPGGSDFVRCAVTGARIVDKDQFTMYVVCDEQGQVTFTFNIYYEKSSKPDVFSASLVELCNELNASLEDCCAKLEFHPESEGKSFCVLVAVAFIIPLTYYRKKVSIARELHECNLAQFLDDADYYYNELGFMIGRLSETGLFGDETADADEGPVPSEP